MIWDDSWWPLSILVFLCGTYLVVLFLHIQNKPHNPGIQIKKTSHNKTSRKHTKKILCIVLEIFFLYTCIDLKIMRNYVKIKQGNMVVAYPI